MRSQKQEHEEEATSSSDVENDRVCVRGRRATPLPLQQNSLSPSSAKPTYLLVTTNTREVYIYMGERQYLECNDFNGPNQYFVEGRNLSMLD